MTRAENLNVVTNSMLLKGLPENVVDKLLSDSTTRRYARGETVFLQGEQAQVIHIVMDGWVKLYRVAPNGNEAVVSVLTRGRSFGEAVAFRMDNYPVSAEAVTDCTLLLLSARTFISIVQHEPEVAVSVIAATFQHLHQLVTQVEQIKVHTGAQRVAGFLMHLCDSKTGSCIVKLPYDKALIAGRLGMKPESLSRAFLKLKSAGVRVARNHATIDDIEALAAYSEKDPAAAWSKAL